VEVLVPGNLDVRLNPNSVSIGEVALADFFARVIISREGKLNLLQIVRQPDAAPRDGGADQAKGLPGHGKAVASPVAHRSLLASRCCR
jgi:hypothetical protein